MRDDSSTIERREYKYLIDPETAAAVRACIRPYCDLDANAERQPRQRYTVETLYLDTPALTLFWANDHEQMDRVKIRVRGYAEAPDSPVFLEVKRRVNDVICKTRGRVVRREWVRLLQDDAAPIPAAIEAKDRAPVERFLSMARSMHVRPFTHVRYDREPWVSRVDDYARVTFDTRIRARTTDRYELADHPDGWRGLDDAVTQHAVGDSMVVLELKFTSAVPRWMVDVVRSLGLVRHAFSKYGNSIRAFYEKPELRTCRSRNLS